MNLDKVSKVESSYASKVPIERFLDSFAASNSSGSKKNSSPREKEIKNSLAQFSNKRFNAISDGSKALKSNFSCKRILCSSSATKSSPLSQNEVKTSAVNSLNTTRIWNAYCRRLVCSFGGSKSKPSNLRQGSLFKKNESKSPVEGSSKVRHDCKNDLRALMNRSLVASPKLGSPCSNNKERRSNVVGQSARSQLSNPSQVSKVQPVTVMKKQIQITASPKDPQNLTRKFQKSEVSRDYLVATKKREIHKTEGSKASMIVSPKKGIPKPDDQKDSSIAIQNRETLKKTPGSKIPAGPVKKIGTAKTSTLLSSHDKKNHTSSSQYRPYSYIPVYHIRCDGCDKESERSGHNCILCNKDFSYSAQDDYGSHEDAEYKYRIEFRPQLLPCVDVLPCGHAFHSECLRYVIPEEQSTDPQCVLCLSMA